MALTANCHPASKMLPCKSKEIFPGIIWKKIGAYNCLSLQELVENLILTHNATSVPVTPAWVPCLPFPVLHVTFPLCSCLC